MTKRPVGEATASTVRAKIARTVANKHRQSPEEIELALRLEELQALETSLIQAELDLATDEVELREFERLYLRAVGHALAELEALEAQLAAKKAREKPWDLDLSEAARAAEARAQATAEAVAASKERSHPRTENLKRIYREAARKLHPDLAATDEQRGVRHELMSRVNRAYEAGDSEAIQRVLDEWEFAPEAVPEGEIGSQLVRTIRSIARVRRRLEDIARSLTSLRTSDSWVLRQACEAARAEGRDLLAQLADRANRQIAELRHILKGEAGGRGA